MTRTSARGPQTISALVSVTSVEDLSPTFRRVRMAGADLLGASPALIGEGPEITCADAYLKLLIPPPGVARVAWPDAAKPLVWPAKAVQPAVRTYTVRRQDPDTGELDIDFVLHEPAGPATSWASTAQPGDELIVVGPDSRADDSTGGMDFQPHGARRLLLAADESGLPAVRNILQRIPKGTAASVFLEVPTAADCVPMPTANGDVVVTWLVRGEHPYGERLTQAIDAWAIDTEISGSFYAWVAGESTTVKVIRRHLVRQCDLPPSSITFSGYWKIGKAEN